MSAVEVQLSAADLLTMELKESLVAQARAKFVDDSDFERFGAPSQSTRATIDDDDDDDALVPIAKPVKTVVVKRRNPL